MLSYLKREDGDVDIRDHSHGLQTFMMRLCHVRITHEERQGIMDQLLKRHANVNLQVFTYVGRLVQYGDVAIYILFLIKYK